MVETLRKQQTEWSEVKRAAKDGDKVVLDFEGFIGDEAFEGGKGEGVDLILGSSSMIPGFEDAVIGKKKRLKNLILKLLSRMTTKLKTSKVKKRCLRRQLLLSPSLPYLS